MTLVLYAGLILFFGGAAVLLASLAFVAPGTSRFEVFMRGSFQRKRDYTPFGWRVYRWAGLVALVGFGLVMLGVFAAGE